MNTIKDHLETLDEHTYTLSSEVVYQVEIQPANTEWPKPDEYQLVTEETKKSMRCPLVPVFLKKFSNKKLPYKIHVEV